MNARHGKREKKHCSLIVLKLQLVLNVISTAFRWGLFHVLSNHLSPLLPNGRSKKKPSTVYLAEVKGDETDAKKSYLVIHISVQGCKIFINIEIFTSYSMVLMERPSGVFF